MNPARRARAGAIALALASTAFPRAAVAQTAADSAFLQVERLIENGDRARARVMADSLVRVLPENSPEYAAALYWRAFSSSSAADAERDYLRLTIEFPLSRHAPAALLALAQLEYARGDNVAARRRFERLLREYPAGAHVARASYWVGRLALDQGDRAVACAALATARRSATAEDVELVNQIEYYGSSCTYGVDTTATRADTVATQGPTEYSVQVAAFNSRREATALASRLRQRGFSVRVAGDEAPFRVRIGRYPTREAATAALGRMRRSNVTGIVVEAEPP